MQNRIIFRQNNVITIIGFGKTSNKKIALPSEKIAQTYHFSRDQFDNAQSKTTMHNFFSKDKDVCMDCPFAVSNGAKLSACYTHKVMQYSGFLSMLRSIGKQYKSFEDIPELSPLDFDAIVLKCSNLYVRFGTYGEPSLLPIELVSRICNVASTWTGYTHQWRRQSEFAPYFMASVHTAEEERIANLIGYRSFVVASETQNQFINCPASKEMGFKSHCSKCGLCSGSKGKGQKSVVILEH